MTFTNNVNLPTASSFYGLLLATPLKRATNATSLRRLIRWFEERRRTPITPEFRESA
jgi:hypothetical protein